MNAGIKIMSDTLNVPGVSEKKIIEAVGNDSLSPLRYPGGKRRLAVYIGRMMDECGIKRINRVLEPFAGGAAISLAFLEADIADEVVLSDLDPMIAAFWSVVFSSDNSILAERVRKTEISTDLWMKLKHSNPNDLLDLAFKCIYLNRTSFSGSLAPSAGPIGGKNQLSKYPIGCRFNTERIALRIESLERFKDQVRVYNKDFRRLASSFRMSHNSKNISWQNFWYLDPPFFHKADKLYRYFFKESDHKALKKLLHQLDGYWLLSYDLCHEAESSFSQHPGYQLVNTRYSAGRTNGVQSTHAREVIVSNLYEINEKNNKQTILYKGKGI